VRDDLTHSGGALRPMAPHPPWVGKEKRDMLPLYGMVYEPHCCSCVFDALPKVNDHKRDALLERVMYSGLCADRLEVEKKYDPKMSMRLSKLRWSLLDLGADIVSMARLAISNTLQKPAGIQRALARTQGKERNGCTFV
jgi:hypothetical protein